MHSHSSQSLCAPLAHTCTVIESAGLLQQAATPALSPLCCHTTDAGASTGCVTTLGKPNTPDMSGVDEHILRDQELAHVACHPMPSWHAACAKLTESAHACACKPTGCCCNEETLAGLLGPMPSEKLTHQRQRQLWNHNLTRRPLATTANHAVVPERHNPWLGQQLHRKTTTINSFAHSLICPA